MSNQQGPIDFDKISMSVVMGLIIHKNVWHNIPYGFSLNIS